VDALLSLLHSHAEPKSGCMRGGGTDIVTWHHVAALMAGDVAGDVGQCCSVLERVGDASRDFVDLVVR
jgi:hypothetical protein